MFHPPLVVSHRTHAGTMPENTLLGITAALAAGVDAIELDVRATADGVVVLHHDDTLERTTGDPRAVSDVTYERLRPVRVRPAHGVTDSQPIPTLAEVFQAVAGRAIIAVEVKQAGIHELVAAEVRAAGASSWTWIWAFDPAVGRACREALPEVPVSLNASPGSIERFGFEGDPLDLCVREGFAAISWNYRAVNAGTVRTARERGLTTYCWTVNEEDDIERVLRAGVDAVCSDFPDRVQAVRGRLAGA